MLSLPRGTKILNRIYNSKGLSLDRCQPILCRTGLSQHTNSAFLMEDWGGGLSRSEQQPNHESEQEMTTCIFTFFLTR